MNLADLPSHGGEWLRGDGPEAEIVVSSRVRLARNLAGHRFTSRADADERSAIAERVRAAVMGSRFAERIFHVALEQEPALVGELLVERHLISRELARGDGSRGVAFGSREAIAIMINEEDHLRIQVLHSGLMLEEAWRGANAVDGFLERELGYAFSQRFGYLTACPTNVGTGMRASVMLHLPALAFTQHIQKVFRAVGEMSLAVRGLFGEGTEPLGDLYQISNQGTLGVDEPALVARVAGIVPRILQYERNLREELMSRRRSAVEDRAWRALATLRHSRLISTQETLEHLSAVRLGVALGILDGLPLKTINDLFILSQPAHLQRTEGRALSGEERDSVRAAFLRNRLADAMGGGGAAGN